MNGCHVAIHDTIQDADQAERTAPDGHLTLIWRLRIGAALKSSYPSDFRARETALGLSVVKNLEPLWTGLALERCDRQIFYDLLLLGRGILKGQLEERDAWRRLNDLMGMAQFIQFKVNYWKDFYIARAASSACICALQGEHQFCEQGGSLDSDDELDPDDFDTHFLASCAFADGPPWEPTSSPEARRAFWRRWLAEEVPLVLAEDVCSLSAAV